MNRWSHQYADYLAGQVYGVNGQAAAYHPTNERLWIEFTEAFHQQFWDTAEVEKAWAELLNLEMKGNDIDGYIANFETLLAMADRHCTKAGSVDLFKQGLQAGLQHACMAKRPIPHTLDKWEATAQEEVEIKALLDVSIELGKP